MRYYLYKLLVLTPVLLILNLTLLIQNSESQWVQTNGPYGNGTIRCFTFSGNNIFGGSYSLGVFLSTNNGDTWSQTSMNDKYVLALFANGTNIFAGTNFGAFRTTDNGQNWINVSNGLPGGDVYSFALSGTNLYAGTDDGVYVSSNNGNNWISAGLSGKFVTALTINGANIFAGLITSNYQDPDVYLSTNNGTNWSPVGTLQSSIKSLVSSGNKVFAVTNLESNNIFLTTNNGGSWSAIGIQNIYLYCLTVSGTTLFSGTYAMPGIGNHIFRSTDYGGTWYSVSNGLLASSPIISIAVNGSYIFAATEEISRNDVYRSTNNGDNWYLANTGMCYKLVLSLGSFGTNIFAGTYVGGIYYSSNNGNNWTTVNNGLPDLPINALASTGNYLYAGVGYIYNSDSYGIYRSTNNGMNWLASGFYHFQVTHIVIDNNNIYAAGNSANSPDKVFLSTDYGSSWTTLGSSYNYQSITALAVAGSSIFMADNNDSLYRTTNNGVNWVIVNNGMTSVYINALAAIGTNIFVGTGGNGIYLSTNNGNNWTPVNNGLPDAENSTVIRLLTNGSYIFAGMGSVYQGTPKLIYLSTNNGGTWLNKSQGMDTISAQVFSMLVANNYIFAGTKFPSGQGEFGKSVWWRSLSEFIGIKKISENVPSSYSLFQNYPNPFNPTTNISYEIPVFHSCESRNPVITLIVYDALGREVESLVNEKQSPGTYEATWDASKYSSGVYFYRLIVEGFSETKKMLMIK